MLTINGYPFSRELLMWVRSKRSLVEQSQDQTPLVVFGKVFRKIVEDDYIVDKESVETFVYKYERYVSSFHGDFETWQRNQEKKKRNALEEFNRKRLNNIRDTRKPSEIPLMLCELNASQFHRFVWYVVGLCHGMYKELAVESKYRYCEIEKELQAMERQALWWIYHEGLTPKQLYELDDRYLCRDRKALNTNFAYEMFYCFSFLWRSFKGMSGRNEVSTFLHVPKSECDMEKEKDFLVVAIEKLNELIEFVLDVIEHHQRNSAVHEMEMIARIRSPDISFTKPLVPSEIWRRLYPTYFDGDIENFKKQFFLKHEDQCVRYFLYSYLQWDMGIELIPFYILYTDGTHVSSRSLAFFDRKKYLQLERKIYFDYL